MFYVDGEVIPFSGPCCSIIYGGQIHIAQGLFPQDAPPDWNLWQFSYISLKKLFTDTDLMQVGNLKAMSPHRYDYLTVFRREEASILYDLIAAVIDETVHLREGYLTAIRGLIITLLARHSRFMTPAQTIRQDQAQVLARLGSVLVYINQHYTEDMTIEQLIAAGGMSKSTLQRDMIDFTGMAPMQYIHHLRMKRAAILLKSGQAIADVAFDVGYNTLSSFNRHFLQEFDMSPSQWKKNQRWQ